jgi:hypothetical protein
MKKDREIDPEIANHVINVCLRVERLQRAVHTLRKQVLNGDSVAYSSSLEARMHCRRIIEELKMAEKIMSYLTRRALSAPSEPPPSPPRPPKGPPNFKVVA